MSEPNNSSPEEKVLRGQRWCNDGVDHNGEPTKALYVRADWADRRIAELEQQVDTLTRQLQDFS